MTIQCPKCGHECPEDTVYCGHCGARIDSGEQMESITTETLDAPSPELGSGLQSESL
ncbi:MAG: zinc-ribbon domain-containing protein [Candidatus Aminicenantes bacterium]|nr:zinc-ribbon domain-containing protein [Candidatus Aminicenantes bacterium]